jgi:hypothetical protein
VLALVALVPNAVGRELHVADAIKRLADALDMDSNALFARLDQTERRRRPAGRTGEPAAPPRAADDPAERGILEALMLAPEAADEVFARLTADDIERPGFRQVFEAAKILYDEDGAVNVARLLARLTDPEPAAVVSGIANGPPRPRLNETFCDCVRTLLKRRSQKQIRDIRRKLDEAKAQGNEALADDLSARYLDLQREVLAL